MHKNNKEIDNNRWPQHLMIVRHGQSKFNEERELINRGVIKEHTADVKNLRTMDTPLSEFGEEQARKTGEGLANAGKEFDVIYCSPFKRAYQTAQIIKKFFPKADFIVDERIREKEFGVIDGLIAKDIQEKLPLEWDRIMRLKKYYYRPAGGESYPDVNLRVWSFLTALRRDHQGEKILVISHEAVMLCFRKVLEKFSEKQLLTINEQNVIKNCATISYVFNPQAKPKPRMKLEAYNSIHY